MPLSFSYNSLAQSNEQPEYQALWEPIAFNPASVATLTFPTAAGGGYAVPGTVLMYGLTGTPAGVGSYPPLGFNTSYPGGDAAGSGATGNPTFPYNWTVQYVDAAATTSTTYLAGICLGFGSLGQFATPQNLTTPSNSSISSTVPCQVAMVGKRGIMQVLVDNTTVVGDTLICSTTHTGQAHDTGGSTRTYGTTLGVALQAVTVSTGALLCWAHINMP
jgi:hypothetical protein